MSLESNGGVYTMKQTSSKHKTLHEAKHEANLEHTSCTCIFNSLHLLHACFMFASSCKRPI